MTAEVFLVIASIGNISATLNTLKSLVIDVIECSRAFDDAQRLLKGFESQLEDSQAEFEIWKDFWGLENHNTSEHYHKILWGKYGEWVQKRLISIQNVFESIQQDLAPFLTELKPSDRLEFVSLITSKTKQNLSQARDLISGLKTVSADAYYAKHRIQVSNGLSEQQLQEARSSLYIDLAMEARSSARGIYESCYKASMS